MAQETWEDRDFAKERLHELGSDVFLFDSLHHSDTWRHTFDNNFASNFFKCLSSSTLPTQLVPVYCCACCTSIVSADCDINISEVSVAANNCRLCALLLRTVKRHCNSEQLSVRIVRKKSALEIRTEGSRILRLCSDLENLADPDNDFPIGFPAWPEAKGLARFELLRAWLRWCDEDESHVCNKHDAESEAAMPTRLIYAGELDTGVLRLHCPRKDDRVKYVALSHCWGNSTNKNQFCTTDSNKDARLESFSFSDLPDTFKDAVRVTRELGLQYVWIDSLCMIQGNQDDWEYESKRMEGVYASAYCTIAATSAADSNAGFLERKVHSDYVYAQDASGRRFYVCTDIDDFDHDVEKARLNKRAWVMQERALSRRTIHFTANQTYFECGEGVYCENLTRLEVPRRKKFFMLDPYFPNRLLKSGDSRTREFINFFFEEYSKRDLTKKTDRCVAVSGLEARISRAIKSESRYGIFQKHLHKNLLWQASDEDLEQIAYEKQCVPSWSWMAYSGGIQYVDSGRTTFECTKDLKFHDEDKHALVTDVGAFQNCSLKLNGTSYAILDSSKTERGWIRYDVKASGDLHAEWCAVIGRNEDEKEQYYILVVRPTDVHDQYRRVGVGSIPRAFVVRQRRSVLIV